MVALFDVEYMVPAAEAYLFDILVKLAKVRGGLAAAVSATGPRFAQLS